MTMTTPGLPATHGQNAKELDSMKESISDIINQLQDIDPTRLSFSPFLDLDTQISLAPVSDSPESSVEELHSSSHSVSGSQNSLEPTPAAQQLTSSAPCHQQPGGDLPDEPRADQTEETELDQTVSSPITTAHDLEADAENGVSSPTPASQGEIPNGADTPRWSPETTNLDSTADEGRPLIGPPPESVELAVWSSEGRGETGQAAQEASDRGQCYNSCHQCTCCPALLSGLFSLLLAAAMLFGLYLFVPFNPPDLPNPVDRVFYTLCCCVVAAIPVLLAMLVGAVCQFCTCSFDLQESSPRGRAIQQLFVDSSTQQLSLYVLNLVVMAVLLPQNMLKVVPLLVGMFIFGRLVYWVTLNVCSTWRGFGSGLTVFPLLGMVAFNLYLLYSLNLKMPLLGSQDVLYNQVTPTSWSGETSQSSGGTPHILDAQ